MKMKTEIRSIRPFIGARDFEVSRRFYRAMGFKETELSPVLSVFGLQGFSFYLQDSYIPDWVENTMVFMEVDNIFSFWDELIELKLEEKFPFVRLTAVRHFDWGSECYLHDPSGILWHFGQFKVQ